MRRINSSPKLRPVGAPITEGESRRDIARRDAMFRRSLALADFGAAALALVMCVSVAGDDRLRWAALLALPLVVLASKLNGLYDRDELLIHKTTIDEAPRLLQLATLYTLLVVLLETRLIEGHLGSTQIIVLWGSLFVSAVLARRIARGCARAFSAVERCLFVGGDESYERLRGKLEDRASKVLVVGRMSLDDSGGDGAAEHAMSVFGSLVTQLNVHRVIIEPSEASPELTLHFVREAKSTGLRVSLLPRVLEVVGSSIEIDDINGLTLLAVRRFGLTRSSQAVKRTFDLAGAIPGLLAISPVMLTIAVLIKLDSRGPVFFRQTRVGRDGRMFRIWKFRTMDERAEERKADLVALNEADGLFKIAEDPRITRVGRWLRRYSLDELPQLFNVVRGEMSLVGPRPLIVAEDEQIIGAYRRRLHLHAGHDGTLADPGLRARAAHRDGQAGLPVSGGLVAVVRREDPAADRALHAGPAGPVARPAGPGAVRPRCGLRLAARQSFGSVSGSVRFAHRR